MKRALKERVIERSLQWTASLSILIVICIFVFIFKEAAPFAKHPGLGELFGDS